MAPCQGRHVVSFIEYRQVVAVTGAYTVAGASDVQLTCGVVRNGVTVARFTDKVPGPVAAIAEPANVSGGAFTVCHELVVTYLDKPSTSTDYCP
jgi:hypothetical protein